jgi:gamma-glutamyltranspeptidase
LSQINAAIAIGSPGALRITTAIAQVLANFATKGMNLADTSMIWISFARITITGRSGK